MSQTLKIVIGAGLALLVFVGWGAFYTVSEVQQVIVTQSANRSASR